MYIWRLLQKDKGFMLVELSVCFGLLVLLLAAAVPVWQMGLRLWQRESAVSAVQQDGRIVLEMVGDEIRRARKESVEIVIDSVSGQTALKFAVDEGLTTVEISYLQGKYTTSLIRRKNKGDGAGTNVYLTNLNLQKGFAFAFVDPYTGSRRMEPGSHLQDNEVLELVLCCQRNNHDYTMQIQVAPRN